MKDRVLANWGSYQQARAMLHEIIDAVAKKDRDINRIGITDFLIAYSRHTASGSSEISSALSFQ